MESLFSPVQRPPSPTAATAPTTDFALIESQKENIRPLASGRSAATLSSVFKEPSAVDKVVQEGHERHRKDIEEAERRDKEGEDMIDGVQDVLDVYNKYILFVVQHHPSSDSHLLPLLETTTRRFVNDARYTQDVRYLKLWVMYARQIERREEIWAFLESRDIGTKHSVFYEEWAAALEGLGRRKKADEIYRIGVARKAAPVDRLKTRHKQFLERIMAPPSGVVPDDDPMTVASMAVRTPGRSVLGQVAAASTSVAGATQLAPSLRLSSKSNGSKMEIFTDDGGRSAEESAPGEWADFGTRDGRRKENTVEAGPWKGETLPQSAARGRVAPRTPKVEVFKDVSQNDAVRAADEVFSRIRQQPPTEAELLKSDPLRHYDTSALSTDIPSLPAPPSARKPPKASKPAAHFVMKPWECPTDGPEVRSNAGKVERRMFDWNNVFKGNDEWSFEEVRARQRGLIGKEWKGEVKEWEMAWHKPGSSTPKKEEKKQKPPSPTVNTKLAELEVMRMFDQTIHGGKVRDAESDSDESSSDEEDEPIQTAPTPLPTRTGTISMLATPGGFVPPTPTPAPGYVSQNRLFTPATIPEESIAPPVFSDENASRPAVFSDENAVPPSASKAGKFNIFSDTPAKTPLASRTPLAASTSKPRAFGIFTEEGNAPPPPPAFAETSASAQSRQQPATSNNVFATPVPARHVPLRRGTTEVIQEVPESDEDASLIHEVAEDVAEVHLNDVEEDQEQPRGMRRFQINTMTPITERTCEYTNMTNARLSMTGSSRQFSIPETESELEEGNAFLASSSRSAPLSSSVSADVQEREREQSAFIPVDFDKSGSPDDDLYSGDVEGGFQLPEGFTIHNTDRDHSGSMHTMRLVEGTDMDTMHTAGEGSVEPDTDAFVTASQPAAGALPNPCNPADIEVVATLLASIDPPLSSLSGFMDYRNIASNRLGGLQKHARSKVRRASTSSRNSIAGGDDTCSLDLQGKMFEIRDKIGEGGFGAVFLAVDVEARQAQDDADSDDEDDEEKDNSLVAVKVEQPCSVWEAVILDRINRKIDTALRSSIVQARNLYAFQDESFLALDYSHQGTLLDIVNKATTMGIAPSVAGGPSAVDELLAIFFTIELLKLVEGLHRSGFIHGDLKIDNCLVRLDDLPNPSSWSANYDPSGDNGWSYKGVKLIDFGRAIDLSLYPAGEKQQFVVDWKTDERDCKEMRENRSWSYQTDYFGLAGVAYCMLFGKYMGTESVDGKEKIDMPLKRYWQSALWNSLFDALLSPGNELPITDRLVDIRREFESWLAENCQKGGKSLKSMLKKIELAAITGRK
ncbi:hypothetical protein CI109_104355 [Kwoniella shandongensis]|uniref:Uncharacterized protein n=1 Tax=Kwoniella shandongensis TaxID=1734106 RepID=A0A5M6BXJ0_9TREE|nr:uncharacterized protein CI109_004249 [Kwoniella shandongensis]KAA5527433.1 hypothetical protein CI109_004249 [Kwoniella shandongensis]